MLRIPFKFLEFALERFEPLSKGSNLHLNASNACQMIQICIRMLRIPFEWFEFALEGFKSFSNGSNLLSNTSNPFRMIQICIRMFQMLVK